MEEPYYYYLFLLILTTLLRIFSITTMTFSHLDLKMSLTQSKKLILIILKEFVTKLSPKQKRKKGRKILSISINIFM